MLKARRLYYKSIAYYCLPDWAWYFINLGQEVARYNTKKHDIVIASAIPTRAFAAALIGLGAVQVNLLKNNTNINDQWSQVAYGTQVVVKEGTKRVKGTFIGTKQFHDSNIRIGVDIQYKRGTSMERWFMPDKCIISTLPSGSSLIQPQHKENNKNSLLIKNQKFIIGFISMGCLQNLISESNLACIIVGRLSVLQGEIKESIFATNGEYDQAEEKQVSGEFSDGYLQDILRVKRFLGPDQTCMTDIFPIESRKPYESTIDTKDSIVIFDGATGYLKWRENWSNNTKIVILDYTEAHFAEAVSLINTEFINRSGLLMPFSIEPPDFIETIAFIK